MRVTKTVHVEMDNETMRRLNDGESVQIPLDEEQGIVIHPPDGSD